MKYQGVEDLLDNKSADTKDTVRPNINVDDKVWHDFTYALEYVNTLRATKLHANVVIETFLGDFIKGIQTRMLKEEGTDRGFLMHVHARRLERAERDADKKGTLRSKFKETRTLDYSGKKPKHKDDDE